ncbi:PREDICTED: F-box protein At3g07870-like [Ipomoea nil]|uniref:F-box protein At3g07870-like n=1 Tax=Ipomoea nil TaxID=35883 RepID=UPI0009019135|nr:PREDICTED: F-box protein At3g07870-like [Ipomoea nil]
MDELSSDVIIKTLSVLPIKPLVRCRFVCKSWLNLTHDPHLIDTHLSFSSENETHFGLILKTSVPIGRTLSRSSLFLVANDGADDLFKCVNVSFSLPSFRTYEIMGSCNGLLCLFNPLSKHLTHIFNPCTREYMVLPSPQRAPEFIVDIIVGFGFLEEQKEYKLVEVVYYGSELVGEGVLWSKVNLYSLGDKSWKSLGYCPYSLCGRGCSEAFVNGALHWVSSGYDDDGGGLVSQIVAFDLARESFEVVPSPEFDSGRLNYSLGVLRGCLSATKCKFRDYVEIWVMKSYGVKESWTKCLKIVCDEVGLIIGAVRPLFFQKNGEILLLHGGVLLSYDPLSKKLREVRVSGMPRSFKAFVHVGSLVSPCSLVGK